MDGSQLAVDAMIYVGQLSPILLLLGAICFADLSINFVVNIFRAAKEKRVKW